jgi:hypothetical protein
MFFRCLEMQNDNTNVIETEKMNANGTQHVEDEPDSETSFGGEQDGLLDRWGMKMDDALHAVFTMYVFYSSIQK